MPRPLDCEQVLERLEAFVDGDLDLGSVAAFAAHLESCSGCAAEWTLARDVRRELQALPSFDAPPAVLREVFRRVGEERFRTPPRTLPRSRRPAWPALAAAAALAAIVAGGIFLSRQTVPAPDPARADLEQTQPDPEPSPEEVARATEEARLAFAHVARVSRKAGFQVRDDLGEHLVAISTRSLSRALLFGPHDATDEGANGEPRPDRS